jgi:UDP-glucose 4-epimerase
MYGERQCNNFPFLQDTNIQKRVTALLSQSEGSDMTAPKALVTGAGGFLGSHICRYFFENGAQVIGIDSFPEFKMQNDCDGLSERHVMTLPDKRFGEMLRETKPDMVIHCAGSASVPFSLKEPYADFKGNAAVTAFVLESIWKESPDSFFVLFSSAAVYGNPEKLPVCESAVCSPISPYGYHKYFCELIVEQYSKLWNIRSAVIRIFSAYGERLQKQVVYDLTQKFGDLGPEVIELFGTGEETRDFIHAEDVARAVFCIVEKNATGVFNVASGTELKIVELARLIRNTVGSSKTIRFNGKIRQGDPLKWCADIRKLKELGFEPKISIDDGVRNYCKWAGYPRRESESILRFAKLSQRSRAGFVGALKDESIFVRNHHIGK